jgi:ribosomal protein S1
MDERYVGKRLIGHVIVLKPFGAFIDVGSPVWTGLVELPEISSRRIGHSADVLSVGQTVEVEILALGPGDNQLRLSIKRCEPPEN